MNRLGSPLRNVFWEPVWISVVGTRLDLDCVNTLGSPLPLLPSLRFAILLYILWTLQAMAGRLSAYRGGWGLRSPTRGTYALWEPAWISVVLTALDLHCVMCFGNRFGSPLWKPVGSRLCKHAWISITTTPLPHVCYPLVYFVDPPGNGRAPLCI